MAFNKFTSVVLGVCLWASVASAQAITGTPKHMVFASDTQYPWTDKTDSRHPESDAEFDVRSKWLVDTQLSSIADFRRQHGSQAEVPLMINGDITAFGHGWQRSFMKEMLSKHFKGEYLYGLGNHDYENNVDDCFTNSCAAGSIVDFKEHHEGKVDSFDLNITDGFLGKTYSGSLAYSKKIGEVHMVQLNNEPTYTTRISHPLNPTTFEINDALDWLEKDLRLARVGGYAIIINMHKPFSDKVNPAQNQRFLDMISKYQVTAVFAGHLHEEGGNAYWKGKVPMYLSGSTSQQTYLIASFTEDRKQLEVYLVKDNQWRNRTLIETTPVHSIFARRP
ncbi:metallophosphoesterase family protein [Pseudomonas fluorescens]|uniref:3',5'-cyclic adenosine monophosphate phosphodiesterase CpdA n=1 Tax=Pseudomonas fluorescens TaxID=294 RepID=A0A5E6TYT4_PSEFL|nr:metallophosphoesterase [Pseudomonas fluorescens]VVM96113.1 3',5'-cyclic adenosine monophosphate phosphodiesterase CpdA [Pseudomonas fluorescens]